MSIKKLARTGRSSREVQQSLFRRRPLFEALERRYLMSAELVPPPPPPAGEQAPVTMPAQPGQAGPQAKKTSAPGAHPYLVERAAFQKQGVLGEQISLDQYAKANAARQGDAKAWLPGQAAGQPAPLTAIEGYTTQSERTPVRQIIFVDPSIDNAEQMVQGCTAWSAARPKDWADWPGRRARARSCRCCAAMTPRSSCWTAAMTASTRSPESWGSTRTWRPCRS